MKNDGKELEKLVHLISTSLEPDANVEHNQFLPVIGSPSERTRQCDIVIYSGPKHRRSITLVEVQDRDYQTDINTFNGWLEKLNEVGAQHLICVSRKEFPESIKEKAFFSGNKVKLITMREISGKAIPLDFLKMKFKYFDFKINRSRNLDLSYSKSETEGLGIYDEIKQFLKANSTLSFGEKIFSFDKIELVNLHKVCLDNTEIQKGETSGTNKIKFERDKGRPIYLYINGLFTRISLEVEFEWQNEVMEYPVSIISYDQLNDGSLAWVFEGQSETPSGKIFFKIPITKNDNGYQILGLMTKFPEDVEITLYRGDI